MEIKALFINVIVYFILIIPIIFIFFYKKTYSSKKQTMYFLAISFIIETLISILMYHFSYEMFSLFTKSTGLVNLCVFCFRMLFLDSPVFGIKILLPAYLINKNKKTVILVLSKITVNLLIALLGYLLFNSAGFLYSFPLCDLIYYVLYIILFAKN